MSERPEATGDDAWDEGLARDLVGSTLLVGLTYVNHIDHVIRRRQIFGVVTSVDPRSGIRLTECSSGETVTIAPILDAIEPGTNGAYQMSAADMTVEDPDFVAFMTIRSPPRN